MTQPNAEKMPEDKPDPVAKLGSALVAIASLPQGGVILRGGALATDDHVDAWIDSMRADGFAAFVDVGTHVVCYREKA